MTKKKLPHKEYKKYCTCCDIALLKADMEIHRQKKRHKEKHAEYLQIRHQMYLKTKDTKHYSERFCKYCEKTVSNYYAHRQTAKHIANKKEHLAII